jgi:hypothetical protein
MNASTPASGSSGARAASSASSSRSPSAVAARCRIRSCAETSPAWRGPGSRKTVRSSPRAAAGPGHRSSRRRPPCRPRSRESSGGGSPRMARRSAGAARPARSGRTTGTGASPAPGRHATQDSGHRRPRASSRRCASITLDRCSFRPGSWKPYNSHSPKSGAPFTYGTPYRASAYAVDPGSGSVGARRASSRWAAARRQTARRALTNDATPAR